MSRSVLNLHVSLIMPNLQHRILPSIKSNLPGMHGQLRAVPQQHLLHRMQLERVAEKRRMHR